METKDLTALGAMLVSLISAGVSIYYASRATNRAEETLRLQKQSSERADEVLHLQLNALKRTDKNLELQYLSKIQDWAKEVILTMSEAILLGEYNPSIDKTFFDKRVQNLSKLSGLLDQGRMFFPNYEVPFGKEKPLAYQGTRPKVLDRIKEVFDLVKEMNYEEKGNNKGISVAIIERKRHFVSEVQKIISPRETEQFFKELRENLF